VDGQIFIAILEDDERRQGGMARLLAASFPEHDAVFFDNAPDMLAWLAEHLADVSLVCLDHDLGPSRIREGERFEPGTGRDVANLLAGTKACCPVVIHTSNYIAAPGMVLALESGGWSVDRVVPFRDLEWLEEAWFPTVTTKIKQGPYPPSTAT
jgi:hypothetical protein